MQDACACSGSLTKANESRDGVYGLKLTFLMLPLGLCGLFDGDAYNDLILPTGERYLTILGDVQYGILSPFVFIEQWK